MTRFRAAHPDYNDKYLERGQRIVEAAKAVPCDDCGERYPHYVMDFDHRDPLQKLFNIGSLSRMTSVAKLLAEIAKCDVVCANCHRERTHVQSGGHHQAARNGDRNVTTE